MGPPEQSIFASALFKKFRTIALSLKKNVWDSHEGTRQISRAILDMPLKQELYQETEHSFDYLEESLKDADELIEMFNQQLHELEVITTQV